MRLKPIVAGIALLGLAACGSGGDGNGSSDSGGGLLGGGEVHLQPGQWEVTSEIVSVEAPGMPAGVMDAMKGKVTTVKSCITPEQAAHPGGDFFADKTKSQGCESKGFEMKGGRINGTMTCGGKDKPGTMTMVMDGKYSARSYEMTVNMKTDSQAGSMTMQSRGSGKYLGACPADQQS